MAANGSVAEPVDVAEEAPVMYAVPVALLQLVVNVAASLPYNHPAGDGLVCGDVVNALRALKPTSEERHGG